MLDRGELKLGALRALLQFLGLLDSELLLLGKALLQFGVATLRLLELGLQPEHLIPLLLEVRLMLNCTSKLAVFHFGCADIPGLAFEVDANMRIKGVTVYDLLWSSETRFCRVSTLASDPAIHVGEGKKRLDVRLRIWNQIAMSEGGSLPMTSSLA